MKINFILMLLILVFSTACGKKESNTSPTNNQNTDKLPTGDEEQKHLENKQNRVPEEKKSVPIKAQQHEPTLSLNNENLKSNPKILSLSSDLKLNFDLASFSLDRTKILIPTTNNHSIILWNLSDGTTSEYYGHADQSSPANNPAILSPDGKRMVTISHRIVTIWDVTNGTKKFELGGLHTGMMVKSAIFSSDGTKIITVLTGGTVAIWDLSR